MEVVILAAKDASTLQLDSILCSLQSSAEPIEILEQLPMAPELIHDNHLFISRQYMTVSNLAFLLQDQTQRTNRPRSSGDGSSTSGANGELDTNRLMKKLAKKSKMVKTLTAELEAVREDLVQAIQKATHLQMEQEQLFEDVQEMKYQYDKLLLSHNKIMWEYLPARDPDMQAIPCMATQIEENPTMIGKYPLQQVLGYGQYAVVYSSSTPDEPNLAIKAIDKEKLTDLVALHRVNSEIASLRDPALHHPGILAMKDVIHTPKYIYLVTERGGKDLFECFGAQQEGLLEETIKPLMHRIALAVRTLHCHNYCHRDLKPENILYSPNSMHGASHLVKLIDFGLCTKAVTAHNHMLHDFCGSPGFFAPEIILDDCYDGMKADIWSLGCILLELALGNAVFVAIWMGMYEVEILKDHERFAEHIKASLLQAREYCHSPKWGHSTTLRHLLLSILCPNPRERFTIHEMLDHPWFNSETASSGSASTFAPVSPLQRTQSESVNGSHPRSPVKTKSAISTPSPPTLNDGIRLGAVIRRQSGTNTSSLPVTPPTTTRPQSTAKLNLPSLSPEKPIGQRSHEKAFSQRHVSDRPPSS